MTIGVVPAVALAGAGHHGPPPGKGHGHGNSGTMGPTGATGPTGPSGHGRGHGKSHKCKAHKVAYIVSGTVASSALAKNNDGTYSGTLTVNVTKTNHHAADDKGKAVTYTLNHARVKFDNGTSNPPAPGDRVKVIGKITTVSKKCTDQSAAGLITVRQVVVHGPASGTTGPTGATGATGSTGPTGPTGPQGG